MRIIWESRQVIDYEQSIEVEEEDFRQWLADHDYDVPDGGVALVGEDRLREFIDEYSEEIRERGGNIQGDTWSDIRVDKEDS
jgi:hypothetical protein